MINSMLPSKVVYRGFSPIPTLTNIGGFPFKADLTFKADYGCY